MKIYKSTIVTMFALCAVTLGAAFPLEYGSFSPSGAGLGSVILDHRSFYQNIAIGVFGSSLLVLIPAIVGYVLEKKRYYVAALQTSGRILDSGLALFAIMDKNNQSPGDSKYLIESYSTHLHTLVELFTNATRFFKLNHRDKLIESMLIEMMRVKLFLDKLQEKMKALSGGAISQAEYAQYFDGFKREFLAVYRPEFEKYKGMIDQDMKGLIEDRALNKYM